VFRLCLTEQIIWKDLTFCPTAETNKCRPNLKTTQESLRIEILPFCHKISCSHYNAQAKQLAVTTENCVMTQKRDMRASVDTATYTSAHKTFYLLVCHRLYYQVFFLELSESTVWNFSEIWLDSNRKSLCVRINQWGGYLWKSYLEKESVELSLWNFNLFFTSKWFPCYLLSVNCCLLQKDLKVCKRKARQAIQFQIQSGCFHHLQNINNNWKYRARIKDATF